MSTFSTIMSKAIRHAKQPSHQFHGFSDPKHLQLFNNDFVKIPEDNLQEKILIRDWKAIKGRMRLIKRMGLKHFSIVSDFDQTLTKSYYNGTKVMGTLGMFKGLPAIENDMKIKLDAKEKEFKELESKQETLEGKEEVAKKFIEETLKIISAGEINKSTIQKVLDKSHIVPRHGFDSFLRICNQYDIPFYLISAGISNIIASVFSKYFNFENYQNFHLYSNEMEFDEKDKLCGFKGPYLHFNDKSEIFHKDRKYNENILLIGDHLQDIRLAKNMNLKHSIKIGYVNFKFQQEYELALERYIRCFDFVVVNDAGLSIAQQVVRYVLDLESEQDTFKFIEERAIDMQQALKEIHNIRKGIKETDAPQPSLFEGL